MSLETPAVPMIAFVVSGQKVQCPFPPRFAIAKEEEITIGIVRPDPSRFTIEKLPQSYLGTTKQIGSRIAFFKPSYFPQE